MYTRKLQYQYSTSVFYYKMTFVNAEHLYKFKKDYLVVVNPVLNADFEDF